MATTWPARSHPTPSWPLRAWPDAVPDLPVAWPANSGAFKAATRRNLCVSARQALQPHSEATTWPTRAHPTSAWPLWAWPNAAPITWPANSGALKAAARYTLRPAARRNLEPNARIHLVTADGQK